VLLLLAAAMLGACDAPERAPTGEGTGGLAQQLGGDANPGFARADQPRDFRFPHDHGPHPDYRNEWWYITGNLDGVDGGRYGFQVTFFRVGLAPGEPERTSRWATHTLWMAHLAVTDAQAGAFAHRERFARGGGMRLAGAERDPVRVWLEDWSLERAGDGNWHLDASADGLGVELSLRPERRPVLQGEAGWSKKGSGEGDASYYYSVPRLAAEGHVEIGGRRRAASGTAWLDREWSTSALGADQQGWDWFALQLDDGRDIMLYRLRTRDGTTDPHSAGTIVAADGSVRRLTPSEFSVEATDHWQSPHGGRYPSGWRLTIDGIGAPLRVEPVLADQELDAALRYWEGAVDVRLGEASAGRGYVELTGYAEARDRRAD